jgi:hypothetical protein
VVSSEHYQVSKPYILPDYGSVAFPVGWRNISLCYATLHFNLSLPQSIEKQAQSSARQLCDAIPFESFAYFGDQISRDGIANVGLWCDERFGLPTIMIDAEPDHPHRDCPIYARRRCNEHVTMALLQRVNHTVMLFDAESKTVITKSRAPECTLPRRPLPSPNLLLATALGKKFHSPDDGLINHQFLTTPLRVILWPKLFDRGFFRERKIVLAGIASHPQLELVVVENNSFWPDTMTRIYGEPLPLAQHLEGDKGFEILARLESRRHRKELGLELMNEILKADIVVWVSDNPSNITHVSAGASRYLSLMDPRGLVPASRLVVIDYRDGGARSGVFPPPSERAPPPSSMKSCDENQQCQLREKLCNTESSSQFIQQEKCALYLERSWYHRHEGMTVKPGVNSEARFPTLNHQTIDFTISDEFLPTTTSSSSFFMVKGDTLLTTALPFASHLQHDPLLMELTEAEAWESERPLKLVCLLRPSNNMPCRVRLLRWVAELCLEHKFLPSECFVGQWSDVVRESFDENYYNILRRAQIVITQKPCSWYGDYRTYESLSSGALVVMDPLELEPATLLHGTHVLFFNPTSEVSFKSTVNAALSLPLLDKYRMARDSHLFALRHYRSVSRMDAVFTALMKTWEKWPPPLN